MKFTYKKRDGTLLQWSGQGVCVCTRCEDTYNSVAAFERHIRAGKHLTAEEAGLIRGKKGSLVISLEKWG